MQKIALLLLALAAGLTAGCEAVSARVHERFAEVPPQTRVFAGEARAVFEASQLALRRIDFTVTRAAFAQGIVEGQSRILTDDAFRGARQFRLELRLHALDAGQHEMAARLTEQEASAARGGESETARRAHGLYGAYFAALEAALKETAK